MSIEVKDVSYTYMKNTPFERMAGAAVHLPGGNVVQGRTSHAFLYCRNFGKPCLFHTY